MHNTIIETLHNIESQYHVRILYACESGSRAWGMESKDSDYDVRFIYVHSRERYLSLDVPRDVIEQPINDNLDINGWDIYKALRLLRKSNPTLLEWLYSPKTYIEASPQIVEMRAIAQSSMSPIVNLHYHYLHIAEGHYQKYIKDKSPVLLKKYLYVLRPLIMLMYLDQHDSFPLSVDFPLLLFEVKIADEVRGRICELIIKKRHGDELGLGEPDPVLNAFIEESLERWDLQKINDSHDRQMIQQETERILQGILSEETSKDKDGRHG